MVEAQVVMRISAVTVPSNPRPVARQVANPVKAAAVV
jgi:hypothetical protein